MPPLIKILFSCEDFPEKSFACFINGARARRRARMAYLTRKNRALEQQRAHCGLVSFSET